MNAIPVIQNFQTIVLANGAFPTHAIPLSFLHSAKRIICCDGATEILLQSGKEPDFIVGDLDSLSDGLKKQFAGILYHDPDQETNDLTKAVHFCIEKGWTQLSILGATGKREDHSLGNISLLADYIEKIEVQLLTDYGSFVAVSESSVFESFPRQQVSLFSLQSELKLSSQGLRYPLREMALASWWQGTLNEAVANHFSLEMKTGKILIFRRYNNHS